MPGSLTLLLSLIQETLRNQNVSHEDKGLAVVDWLKENLREPFDTCIDKVKAIDQVGCFRA